MISELPKISVVMPVYNAQHYVQEAIESILSQTYTNFELLILNDQSTDDSLDVLMRMAALDCRIILVNIEINSGPAVVRNQGVAMSKGSYIAFMDADDVSMSNRFEKQIKLLDSRPDIAVCGSWFTLFGENIEDQQIEHFENHDDLKVHFLNECYVGNPTVMCRKEVFESGQFNRTYFPMDDYELWSRLIAKHHFYNIQESLLRYRWHQNNISSTKKVNLKEIHNKIRINQLKELGIDSSTFQYTNYLDTLLFTKKQNWQTITSILKCKNELVEKNRAAKIFSESIFENQIDETIKKTVLKAKKYNVKLLIYLVKNEKKLFSNLSIKHQIKIIFKSILNL
jgi:glycosyltransferase involved in cell wall biosynthesis